LIGLCTDLKSEIGRSSLYLDDVCKEIDEYRSHNSVPSFDISKDSAIIRKDEESSQEDIADYIPASKAKAAPKAAPKAAKPKPREVVKKPKKPVKFEDDSDDQQSVKEEIANDYEEENVGEGDEAMAESLDEEAKIKWVDDFRKKLP
jgi:hypothetical protein